jgi:hypothetical protein
MPLATWPRLYQSQPPGAPEFGLPFRQKVTATDFRRQPSSQPNHLHPDPPILFLVSIS